MGERTQFNSGDQAPNDGLYYEVGEIATPTSVSDPQFVRMRAGEKFPQTSNHNRKWKKFKK